MPPSMSLVILELNIIRTLTVLEHKVVMIVHQK